MPQTLAAAEFLSASGVILDVRSPAEHDRGHIPGAVSFPLFDNEERARVGTCYKQQGRDAAVELGLAIVGPKLADFVIRAKAIAPDRTLRIHCWRGGMRSGSMAWLLETAGFQVSLLDRGYKGYRNWVRTTLAIPKSILTLGGMTGSGKTDILLALAEQGEQVLDLEQLANHRGSSYGSLGMPPQPSIEQFENLIATHWALIHHNRPVWIESESRMVGTCRVPDELFQQMMTSPILQVNRSHSERVALLLEAYGSSDRNHLIAATERLKKRLGNERTQAAVNCIHQGNLTAAIEIVLDYYDKTYQHDLQRRNVSIHAIDITGLSARESATTLINAAKNLLPVYRTCFANTEFSHLVGNAGLVS